MCLAMVLSPSYVPVDNDHAQWFTCLIVKDLAVDSCPAHCIVGSNNAKFNLVIGSLLDSSFHLLVEHGAVFRMNQFQEGFIGCAECTWSETKSRFEVSRQEYFVGHDIPIPGVHMGGFQGQLQLFPIHQ